MSKHVNATRLRMRRTMLAAALGVSLTSAHSASEQERSAIETPTTRSPQNDIPVTKCEDDLSPGTLRYEIAFAPNAATVDLSGLVCSTITLGGLELAVPQDFLYLKGPPGHQLTIDAAFNSRVLVHMGAGKIDISDLTFANGHNSDDASPYGGCIFSESNMILTRSNVTNCSVWLLTARAYGGGAATLGDLFLYDSRIENSYAASSASAFGGGAFVGGDLRAFNSIIDSNSASATGGRGSGGGLFVGGNLTFASSTVSRNVATTFVGGLYLNGMGVSHTITNSTISQNESLDEYGGIWTQSPLTLANSTIAFNRATYSSTNAYVGVQSAGATLTAQSSIIANNTGFDGTPSDLGGRNAATLSAMSAKNLITSSGFPLPTDTITTCARLQPLGNNGGKTLTHALSIDSPAIDKGDDGGLLVDQRGAPRIVQGISDIGAVERQPGEVDDRLMANGFDELCYQ